MSAGTGVPVHDLGAEAATVGAMLLRPAEVVPVVVGICGPADFYKPAHGHIFEAITALAARGAAVDHISVKGELDARGLLDAVGGYPYLSEVMAAVPGTAGAATHAATVAELAERRRLGADAWSLHRDVADRRIALDDLRARAARLSAAAASNGHGNARLIHQVASEIAVTRPVWLWPRWLVLAAVHLLVGRQGSGKSTFAAWVVAQVSTGRPWPDDADRRAAQRCAMLSLEEPAERLAARLVAAGADLDAVEILGQVEDRDGDGRLYRRPWRLPADCDALEATITELGLALVTIDGLGYSVAGDSHNYANVGSALSVLAGVAERTGCAILGLTHPPKGAADAVTAAIGSTAWSAVARISWVMGVDPTDETGARRVVRPAPGSNYKLPDRGLSFAIGDHDQTEAGYVTGLRPSDVEAQTITSPPLPESDQDDGDNACSALAAVLADGPVWVKDALDQMAAAGFSRDQAKRAKVKLGASSEKFGKPTDAEQGWKWVAPRREHEGREGSASPNPAPFAPFVLPSDGEDPS